ncbi:ketopantoate reductase family protein [Paenibacillus sp. XY044]|uniref:ketopantoate reductase family protein n=1 Tax=Paenibacillus sp. XY044 TaxID=2026089 RepID=UPI000B99CDE2|nr:2-dehydropantoate 2-reductase N-terminal domain-containing protein [Paenibacillus sp. XY044]OZB98925.1 2-dehydropantoate 2-reductase [Paenibacillus sp. XY044]
MNILVYGAGVLGSYLAHVLVRGGHEVTVLARGKRAEELEQSGLVIRHYFQRQTTVDRVRVIRTLEAEEIFDIIFVVMTYPDFPSVLPILAANRSRHIVLVGNNADARGMQQELQQMSGTDKQIAFGFQISAGRRENGRVVCIRGGGQMVLGGLDGPVPFRPLLEKAFESTKYKLLFHEDMDAWLKSHIVPILAMNAALFAKGGRLKEIAKDKETRKQIIAAIDEGFSVLEALGYTVTPVGQATFFRKHQGTASLGLKIYHSLPVARLVDGSFDEIAAFFDAFDDWKRNAGVPTPRLDELEKQFIGSKDSDSR